MIATIDRFPAKSAPAWQELFLPMLPQIRRHARGRFRHLGPEAREKAVRAVVCNCCFIVARLAELDKLELVYSNVLARFGVAQVRDRMTSDRCLPGSFPAPSCRQNAIASRSAGRER